MDFQAVKNCNKEMSAKLIISLENVTLNKIENPWKPKCMKQDQTESQVLDLYKEVRTVLNKITPEKFDILVDQIRVLPINDTDILKGVSNLVYEKAISEPLYSETYAQMCRVLSNIQVPTDTSTEQRPILINLHKVIVTRCQEDFEKYNQADINKSNLLKDIQHQTRFEERNSLKLMSEEEERKFRAKCVGIMRFIGELYKVQMLSSTIVHRCIKILLESGDELNLECVCKLLSTIGKSLESSVEMSGSSSKQLNELTPYFNMMQAIANKQGKDSVSSRIRFMLQDLVELRQANWNPRRCYQEATPKTIDQILKDAERETVD